jgi:hypothetical protein
MPGIVHLDNYKRKWSKTDGMFMEEPLHDEASHGSDAYRTAAVAYRKGLLNTGEVAQTVVNKNKGLISRNKSHGQRQLSR